MAWQGRGQSNFKIKDAGIERAMKRKEDGIRRYTDAKSLSIAVSSAFNSASDLVTQLIGTPLLPVSNDKAQFKKDYEELHAEWYEHKLNGFLDAQDAAKREAEKPFTEAINKEARSSDVFDENKELAAMDDMPIVEVGTEQGNLLA